MEAAAYMIVVPEGTAIVWLSIVIFTILYPYLL